MGRRASVGATAVQARTLGRDARAPGRRPGRAAGAVPESVAVVGRGAPPARAARSVPRPPRSPDPLPLPARPAAAGGLPDGLRARAGQRGDAERRSPIPPPPRTRAVAPGIRLAPPGPPNGG